VTAGYARKGRPAEGAFAGRARPDVAAIDSGPALLDLQRLAGNTAVYRLMSQGAATRPLAVQRWPIPIPEPGVRPTVAPQVALSPKDRKTVEDETRAEIVLAFTAFTDACTANITAMKAAAKAAAELRALFIDIATGFLAPAIANWIVGRMAAKATEKLADEMSRAKVTKLISDTDLYKASFTGATKAVNQALKDNSVRLFGDTAEDVLLDHLKSMFQANAVTLSGEVSSMSDERLIAIWTTYDPQAADVIAYKKVIKQLLDEFHVVEAIGVEEIFSDDTQDIERHLIYVPGTGYCYAQRDKESLIYSAGKWQFRGIVPAYFVEEAKRKEKEEYGRDSAEIILLRDIEDVPPDVQLGKRRGVS
jgi:hypothetical protein